MICDIMQPKKFRKERNQLISDAKGAVMKKRITGLLTKIFVSAVFVLFAGTQGALAEITFPKHEVEVGTEISYIKYEEPDVSVKDTGMMFGIVGSYAYHDKLMLKLEGKWSYGQVDYDGQLSDGTPYTISGINDYMLEFRGLVGQDFFVSETVAVTPYIGFGYRYLNDDPSFDPAGYERESNYFYSPVGIEAIAQMEDGWSLGGTVEFDIFWAGIQKSHLGDFFAGLDTLENDQKEGYGVRGSIRIRRQSDGFDFLIEPFIRYWNIAESETTPVTYSGKPIGIVGYEPSNNSIEIGSKIAARF